MRGATTVDDAQVLDLLNTLENDFNRSRIVP